MEKNSMKKLLFVNACIRGEASRTLELSRFYIDGFIVGEKAAGRSWETEEICLEGLNDLKPLDSNELALRDRLLAERDFGHKMFDHAKKIIAADHVVIGAPYWDLQFPALLKIYLERCSVTGLTFIYNDEGIPAGKCRADSLMYITTSGSPIGDMNFGYDYVCGLCRLFGIPKTYFASAEGLDIIGNNPAKIMTDAKVKITDVLKEIQAGSEA